MKEYRLSGLSCADCANNLEKRIQGIKHGKTASLSYQTGKLKIDERVDLDQVRKILSSERVSILDSTKETEPRINWKGDPRLWLLGGSLLFFLAALWLDVSDFSEGAVVAYLTAIAISGYSTFRKGIANLVRFKFNMDTLMSIALIGAMAIGEWREGTVVALLFGLNEYLEGLGMERARRSMEKLLQAAPESAIRLVQGKEEVVPVLDLKQGDIVIIRPGDKIPSDGTVIKGSSSMNEAAITGESLPVEKNIGDPVFGGSINNEGLLQIKIEKIYQDSAISKILRLVEEAQARKTPTELLIDRFARYYTPAIMLIALFVMLVPPLFFGGDFRLWLYQGLAVLIVGCPCALILSSPIANLSGITRNARHGILVKGSAFLELLGKVKIIAFDKTGTLTKGKPQVEKVVTYDNERFYPVAAALEKSSSHPLARAIMEWLEPHVEDMKDPQELQTVAGRGITALLDGVRYWLGNEVFVKEHVSISNGIQEQMKQLKAEGYTLVVVADQERVLGIFGLADEVRNESSAVIRTLEQLGIKQTIMLTGDHKETAQKIARETGITAWYSDLLPEEKVAHLKKFSHQGKVAMVGDGMNDAPALAMADLGIAMGKGTDSAIETADIVLMQDHLGKLPEAIKVAKRVSWVIRFNIGLSLGLKLIALLLTIPGLLTLWIAILSDMGATILVSLTSLAILWEGKR